MVEGGGWGGVRRIQSCKDGRWKRVFRLTLMVLTQVTNAIDTGETDWKILAIDMQDPLAEKLNGELLSVISHT